MLRVHSLQPPTSACCTISVEHHHRLRCVFVPHTLSADHSCWAVPHQLAQQLDGLAAACHSVSLTLQQSAHTARPLAAAKALQLLA
jgi:hypothetical protein